MEANDATISCVSDCAPPTSFRKNLLTFQNDDLTKVPLKARVFGRACPFPTKLDIQRGWQHPYVFYRGRIQQLLVPFFYLVFIWPLRSEQHTRSAGVQKKERCKMTQSVSPCCHPHIQIDPSKPVGRGRRYTSIPVNKSRDYRGICTVGTVNYHSPPQAEIFSSSCSSLA